MIRNKFFFQDVFWVFLFYGVIAISLLAPIASKSSIPSIADLINHLGEIIQAKAALASGQFPLRLAPLWGYPIFQFYSPSTYLFAGLLYWFITPTNPLLAYQITVWLGLWLGGVYMSRVAYLFTRERAAALLSGVVYMAAPYMVISVFRIGDLNEGVALGILPAVLFYTLHFYYRPHQLKTFLQTSLAWYLLMTTHLVTFVFGSIFIGILLLLMTLQNKRYWPNLFLVGRGYFFSWLLALWFLGPILFFQKYLFIGTTYETTQSLMSFSPFLSSLLATTALITKGSNSAIVTMHPALGWPLLMGFGVCCYVFLKKYKLGHKRAEVWLRSLLILFAVIFLMIWSPFNVWRWLPHFLWIAQYSWRLLGQVMWVGSILFAMALTFLFKKQLDLKHVLLGTFLIMLAVNPWFVSTNKFKISLEEFSEKPFLVYNNTAYLINYNQYPNFVTEIDNLAIDVGDFSKLKSSVNIPLSLLKIAKTPTLTLQGKLQQPIRLTAATNGKTLDIRQLNAGEFNWNIALPFYSSAMDGQDFLTVHFNDKNVKTANWPKGFINKIYLTGFLNSSEIVDIKTMQRICKPEAGGFNCELEVLSNKKLIELPVYYYPQLLKITVNDKVVPYHGVLLDNMLIAGVSPASGTLNKIHIQFRGLPWANYASLSAWMVWLVLLLVSLRKRIDFSKNVV